MSRRETVVGSNPEEIGYFGFMGTVKKGQDTLGNNCNKN